MVSATDPLDNETTYVYDADNELIDVTDARGNTTQYGYNSLGEETSVTLPGQSASTTYAYDEDGDLTSVTDQLGDKTVYTYNSMDWLATESVYPNGSTPETTTYAYDGDGDLTSVTNGLGYTTYYAYSPTDLLTSETDPSGGGTTTYSYDAAGRLTGLADPDGNTTSWDYDQANDVIGEVNPMGYSTLYTYDLMGNETSVTDADGRTIDYGYNADYELTSETWVNPSGGSPLNVIAYTYDADGDMTGVTDNNTAYQYTYNADNEVTSFSDAGTPGLPQVTLTYAYDPDGNETSVSDSLGGVVNYTYDARNELTNETLSGTGISPEAVAYSYDAAGRLTGLTRYSNLAETTEVAATSYSYDDADRMTGITDTNSAGTTLVSYQYTYDAADRVTQEVRTWNSGASTDTLTYGYTDNNQLTSVTHTNSSFANESFSYDANGNQTGTGYTTTTGNEQTASPGWTYSYDHDGNLITATQTSTGDYWTYTYDFRDRMTGAVEKTASGTIIAQATFTYDALDNRIGMDENGTQTWTLYDGSTPVMDFNGSGSLTMRYLWGPTGIVARQTSGGTVSWYLADQLGTVSDLINNSGAIIDHVDFSAFGTVLDESNPSNGDRFMGFAGLERDTVTGLNLAIEREENPGTGRWESQDPLGFAGGDSNLYRYVDNDAEDADDDLGLDSFKGGQLQPGENVPPAFNPLGPNGVPTSLTGTWWVSIVGGGGHSYIRFQNTDTGEIHTVGRYKIGSGERVDQNGKILIQKVTESGLQYDRDKEKEDGYKRGLYPARTVKVVNPTIFAGGGVYGYKEYNNNCTTYAIQAWKYYSGESIPRNWIWFDDPESLEDWIRNTNSPPPPWYIQMLAPTFYRQRYSPG